MDTYRATTSLRSGTRVDVSAGNHTWISDEPTEKGGQDLGPTPMQYLLGALGSCMSITLRLYCEHKGYALEGVDIELTSRKDKVEVDGKLVNRTIISPQVTILGDFDEDVQARLTQVAGRCPVHVALGQGIHFENETVAFA